jgi:uncharacterized protein (DUF2252 family)
VGLVEQVGPGDNHANESVQNKLMKYISTTEKRQAGKALRDTIPRSAHGTWTTGADRRDPIEILECSNQGRLPELVPIRYGRMLSNPFAFLRGSPALMAYDLAKTPVTRIQVQACGDCHLLNFGLFATPERNLIFDINDFDETLQAPWEWDLKRLTTSFVVAARLNGISDQRSKEIVLACGRSYRKHLSEFSEMSPLEVWYYCVSSEDLIGIAPDDKARNRLEKMAAKAQSRVGENLFPKITEEADGLHRFIEQPHIVTRITDENSLHLVTEGIESYRASLPDERLVLFGRYRLEDFALRVVGIGSVGTRCFVGLFFCGDTNPLFLQVKEACPSVLEPYAGKSPFENHGQRVVIGQRLTQAASDIFLGWVSTSTGHDFYVRQLRDMKFSMPVEEFNAGRLEQYAEVCGWTLARAHATSGEPAVISGYLGGGDKIEVAMTDFALAYADQIEQDHAALVAAVSSGRIEALVEADR